MTLDGDNMNVLVLYSALNMTGKENKVDTILTTGEGGFNDPTLVTR